MTLPKAVQANEIKSGVRIRQGHRIGRVVMPWLDGKWCVQFAHHPKGSYTIMRTEGLRIIGKDPEA